MSPLRRALILLLGLLPAALGGTTAPQSVPPLPYRQTDVLFPSNGRQSDLFGSAIAADGATVAIGAPGRTHMDGDGGGNFSDGAVYLFQRTVGGTSSSARWAEHQFIEPPAGVDASWFGGTLALDGDTLAVGALSADVGQPGQPGYAADSGAIFIHSAATGQLQSTITPAEPEEGSRFGQALALDGDTLIATTQHQFPDAPQNAAYVFIRGGNGWTQQARLVTPDGPYRLFGTAAAVSGDVALIGAPGDFNDPAPYDRGIVHVYARSGGVWSAAGTLAPDDGQSGDNFGCAIAFDGHTAVIAACAYNPTTTPPNRAYVFTYDGGVWTQQARLDPADGEFPVSLNSLAFDGDHVLLGVSDPNDPAAEPGGGRAFLFERDGAGWRQTQVLRPVGVEAYDGYVTTVALAGTEALAGANTRSWLNAPGHGVVYAFGPLPPGGGLAYLPALAQPALAQTTGLVAYNRSVSGGPTDIFLITPDGQGRTNLTQTPANEYDPAWSPDGRRLAFIRDRQQLVIRDMISGAETIIPAPVSGPIHDPAWSPDGRLIAFHAFPDYYADLFVVAVDGGEPVNLTQTAEHDETSPAWSPDGTRLAFIDENSLATMRPDGSDVSPIAGALQSTRSLDWSAGGDILYTVQIGEQDVLHVIPAAGGASRPVIANAHDGRWSPDGEQILFTGAGWGIFRVNADGSGLSVVDGSRLARLADWQP